MKVAVGIDVSKLKLDVAILLPGGTPARFEVPNTPCGQKSLLRRAQALSKGEPLHFCMETTGPYHWKLALFLIESGELVSVENPRRVKHYGVVIGSVQKTDRADAFVIARYAQALDPKPWRLAEPHIRELSMVDRRITELKVMQNQETNRLEMPCLPALVRKGIQTSVKTFQKQIEVLERRIDQILIEHDELNRACGLLTTIPGIAKRAAVGLLAEVGDLNDYEHAQDLAAKLGLHPRLRRSGSSLVGRSKISKAGNAHARGRLYMPTVVAIRLNRIIRDFYTKQVDNHKPKKSALIAAERKLVMICYGVLKSGKPFDPHYRSLTT